MEKLQAQDLRVGNYYNHNGEIRQVTPDTILEVWESERVWCKPLPLTEDLLLGFGFNKEYKKGYIGKEFANQDFVLTEPLVMGEWQSGYAFQFEASGWQKYKEFKYAHQLQNFYHALTGEELTLKTD